MITEQPLFTTESFLYGAVGFGTGYILGWLAKKAFGILFKFSLVIGALFVGALVYLQSKQIVLINEKALDNVLNQTYTVLNQTIGDNAINNPIQYIVTQLGLPVTGGLGLGAIIGWARA